MLALLFLMNFLRFAVVVSFVLLLVTTLVTFYMTEWSGVDWFDSGLPLTCDDNKCDNWEEGKKDEFCTRGPRTGRKYKCSDGLWQLVEYRCPFFLEAMMMFWRVFFICLVLLNEIPFFRGRLPKGGLKGGISRGLLYLFVATLAACSNMETAAKASEKIDVDDPSKTSSEGDADMSQSSQEAFAILNLAAPAILLTAGGLYITTGLVGVGDADAQRAKRNEYLAKTGKKGLLMKDFFWPCIAVCGCCCGLLAGKSKEEKAAEDNKQAALLNKKAADKNLKASEVKLTVNPAHGMKN